MREEGCPIHHGKILITRRQPYTDCVCVCAVLARAVRQYLSLTPNTKLSTSSTQLPLASQTVWPCPTKLNLIFAAHKFTEYYKNECNAAKEGGELINILQ